MLQAVPQRTRNSAEVQHAQLAGGRLHLNEGPIDLVSGSMGYWTNW